MLYSYQTNKVQNNRGPGILPYQTKCLMQQPKSSNRTPNHRATQKKKKNR